MCSGKGNEPHVAVCIYAKFHELLLVCHVGKRIHFHKQAYTNNTCMVSIGVMLLDGWLGKHYTLTHRSKFLRDSMVMFALGTCSIAWNYGCRLGISRSGSTSERNQLRVLLYKIATITLSSTNLILIDRQIEITFQPARGLRQGSDFRTKLLPKSDPLRRTAGHNRNNCCPGYRSLYWPFAVFMKFKTTRRPGEDDCVLQSDDQAHCESKAIFATN